MKIVRQNNYSIPPKVIKTVPKVIKVGSTIAKEPGVPLIEKIGMLGAAIGLPVALKKTGKTTNDTKIGYTGTWSKNPGASYTGTWKRGNLSGNINGIGSMVGAKNIVKKPNITKPINSGYIDPINGRD